VTDEDLAQPDGRAEVITRRDDAYGGVKELEGGNTQSGQDQDHWLIDGPISNSC
jgi:hypothetical protein